ncbi:MAG: cupin domain-containing protein [Fibrobacterota bacterium]|nr:MAG: cupin domain-containing protein [Fibrobacterota bacterium]
MNTMSYQIENIGTWQDLASRSYMGVPGKLFLREMLGLTGCEVSMNRMSAGTGMPFLHAHHQNEEVYIVVSGEGTFYLDGDEIPVSEGSVLRVAPSVSRGFCAGKEDLCLVCIQAKEGSLEQATREDGIRLPGKARWME